MGADEIDRKRTLGASSARRAQRCRQIGSIGILLSGLMTLASALTPTLRLHLGRVEDVLPLYVHQTVFAVTAMLGIVLVQLAHGLKRGQRRAWIAAVTVLVATVVAHVAKGLDLGESTVSGALAVYLVANRRHFRAPSDPAPLRRSALALLGSSAGALATAIVICATRRHGRLVWRRAASAVLDRVAGNTSIRIGGRLDRFLTPAIGGVSAITVLGLGWLLLRPALRRTGGQPTLTAARNIVQAFGNDTLSYFALRTDKQRWIYGQTLIAYGVYGATCLVSPDPIGPVAERADAWNAFAQFVIDHGWHIVVFGARSDALGLYEATGMRSLYIGDEALVDVQQFTLEGGAMKGLRQAVNRIARNGYTMSYHDPAAVSEELADSIRNVMTESRRGGEERGFSMGLSRIFDPDDSGLLLAACHAPDGTPAAFCQFVPAGPQAFSLDLMRRSVAAHPNGLTDFVLVQTIEYLRLRGYLSLSLNFAAMRAVLAGEKGDGATQRLEIWVLERLSRSVQIESLWKYNAKFNPRWVPRYLVYDAKEHLMSGALAALKAESIWEFPLIGGLMTARRT